jgi:hypothetical protein
MSDVSACAIFMAMAWDYRQDGAQTGSFANTHAGHPSALIGGRTPQAVPSTCWVWTSWNGLAVWSSLSRRMMIGIPMVLILLPLAAWVISRFYPPEMATIGDADEIQRERTEMGPVSPDQMKVAAVMGVMVVLWILSTWYPMLDVYVVGIGGAVIMFLPGMRILNWEQAQAGTGWDALLLIGGVTSLGGASVATGLAQWLVDSSLRGIADWGPLSVIGADQRLHCVDSLDLAD